MSSAIKSNHPLAEIIHQKLLGLSSVSPRSEAKMINEAAKAATEYVEQIEAERDRLRDKSKPAFPRSETGSAETGQIDQGAPGMTLREYYAGLAMQGLLSAQIHGFGDHPAQGHFIDISVEIADALIAALQEDRDGN